jgi:hypothetical protein
MSVNAVISAASGRELPNSLSVKTNRSGSTMNRGAALALDLRQSDSNSTDTFSGIGNMVTPVAGDIAGGEIVVAFEDIASAAAGKVFVGEGVYVAALRVDASSVNIAKGDKLKITASNVDFAKATVGTDRWHAIALSAATTDNALIPAILYSSGRF